MQRLFLGLLLAAFVALGGLYSLVVPVFEAPDETGHYAFIKYLADHRSLPVQVRGYGRNYAGQEGSQPPLYYAIGTLTTFWIDTRDVDSLWSSENPHVAFDREIDGSIFRGSKNFVAHTDQERFPYQGAVLATHIARLPGVLMGALTILATFLLTRELFPMKRHLAFASASLVAFNPQFVFVSATINSDNLVTTASTFSLLFMVRLLARGPSTRTCLALGLSLAAALLSKLNGLGLLPLAGLALLLSYVNRWRWPFPRALVGDALLVFGLPLLLSGWWYARNQLLYGDPLGWEVMLTIIEPIVRQPIPLSKALAEFWFDHSTFWASFGWGNIKAHLWVYQLLDYLLLLAGLGLLLGFLRSRWRRRWLPGERVMGLSLVAIGFVIFIVALLRWIQINSAAAQGRLLFPAIAPIALFIALGWNQLFPSKLRPLWSALPPLGLSLLALASIPLYILPAYAKPEPLGPEALQRMQYPLSARFGGQIELVGYSLPQRSVRPGEDLEVELYWRALRPVEKNWSLFLHLFGPKGQPIGQVDTWPGWGRLPTVAMRVGEVVRDSYPIRVDSVASTPAAGFLEVGFYDPSTWERMEAFSEDGRPMGSSVPLGRFRLQPWSSLAVKPEHLLQANFEDKVSLTGYDLRQSIVEGGKALEVTLYWKPLEKMEEDYTTFLHLYDEQGRLLAQHDSQPLGGDYPTSLWEPGEVIKDRYSLDLMGVATGKHRLVVGFYHSATGQRLTLRGATASGPIPDAILLDEILIAQGR